MTLDHFALLMLILIVALVVYGAVAVYGIPYEIAKARDHPHREAIGAATWVSLFTLGALWPFLWIWALVYRPGVGWGFGASGAATAGEAARIEALDGRIAVLERDRHQPAGQQPAQQPAGQG